MKALNLITLLLVIIGGINWLLVGAAQFDLVATLFGGQQAAISRIVYVLVGLSALYSWCPSSAPCRVAKWLPSAAASSLTRPLRKNGPSRVRFFVPCQTMAARVRSAPGWGIAFWRRQCSR